MAYVKSVKGGIKDSSHMYNAVDYVSNPSKAERVYYYNCAQGDTYELIHQMKNTRVLWNKDNNIMAHHFTQSFSPNDNITPLQAHEIGIKLISKCFMGYQVVMSTHIDKDHIHNHFIVNNVNPVTGRKYDDNNTSKTFIRNESDKLCREYQLSVIDKRSKFKGIDQTTYQLGLKGKSWKINLTKDLDEALATCKNQSEFISFFENRDYIIKYKDIHITFQKNGEKKGIRADTLAKQFGAKYSKKNIDKTLGVIPKKQLEYNQQKSKHKQIKYKSEYERLEEKYFERNPPMTFNQNEGMIFSKILFSKNPLQFTLNLLRHLFIKNKKKQRKKPNQKFKKQTPLKNQATKDIYISKGNISYKQLKAAPGETAQIKIYAWQLPRLLTQSFFYRSFIDINNGIATVYLKEKDLTKLAKALELSDELFFVKQNEQLSNRRIYTKLKKENSKVNHLVVTEVQRQLLKEHFIAFAYFEKEDKYNIVFAPQDKNRIIEILYPDKAKGKSQQPATETAYERNRRINAELKAIAEKTGDKLEYRIVSSTKLHNLERSDVKFASFRKEDGRNNIVFLSSDKLKVAEILATENNEHINNDITRR